MTAAALRARYMGDTVQTASPARLLVMLYDRLALDLERAEVAIRAKDRAEASSQLLHAQDIIVELRSSLDESAWEGGPGLAALYGWLLTELIAANVEQSAAKVATCREVVEPLRSAWTEAAAATVAA
jgi:flagellar protein FliS